MADILLLTLSIPREPGEVHAEADDVADVLVQIVNDERRRNCEEAGRPEYYRPIMVNLLPGTPQWLDATAQQMLVKAIQIVNLGYAHDDGAVRATDG